jgi:hypothetical protein
MKLLGQRSLGSHDDAISPSFDLLKRLSRKKAVAAHFLATNDALKQAGGCAGVKLVKGRNWREQIAH